MRLVADLSFPTCAEFIGFGTKLQNFFSSAGSAGTYRDVSGPRLGTGRTVGGASSSKSGFSLALCSSPAKRHTYINQAGQIYSITDFNTTLLNLVLVNFTM